MCLYVICAHIISRRDSAASETMAILRPPVIITTGAGNDDNENESAGILAKRKNHFPDFDFTVIRKVRNLRSRIRNQRTKRRNRIRFNADEDHSLETGAGFGEQARLRAKTRKLNYDYAKKWRKRKHLQRKKRLKKYREQIKEEQQEKPEPEFVELKDYDEADLESETAPGFFLARQKHKRNKRKQRKLPYYPSKPPPFFSPEPHPIRQQSGQSLRFEPSQMDPYYHPELHLTLYDHQITRPILVVPPPHPQPEQPHHHHLSYDAFEEPLYYTSKRRPYQSRPYFLHEDRRQEHKQRPHHFDYLNDNDDGHRVNAQIQVDHHEPALHHYNNAPGDYDDNAVFDIPVEAKFPSYNALPEPNFDHDDVEVDNNEGGGVPHYDDSNDHHDPIDPHDYSSVFRNQDFPQLPPHHHRPSHNNNEEVAADEENRLQYYQPPHLEHSLPPPPPFLPTPVPERDRHRPYSEQHRHPRLYDLTDGGPPLLPIDALLTVDLPPPRPQALQSPESYESSFDFGRREPDAKGLATVE